MRRDRRGAAETVEQLVRIDRSKIIWVIAKLSGLDLAIEALELEFHVVGGRVDRDAGEERRRRVDRLAVEVFARVQPRHQLGEADRVDLVDAARAEVVADLRQVAVTASTLRTPRRARPAIDSRPMIVASRVVTCRTVSISQACSIAAETMIALMPARAPALSLMSTTSTRPDSRSSRETSRSASQFALLADRAWTETTHSPSRNCARLRLLPVLGLDGDDLALDELGRRAQTALLLDGGGDGRDLVGVGTAAAADDAPRRSRAWAANSPK